MSIERINKLKVNERRRNRKIVPFVFFLGELFFAWLVLAIIEVDFNPARWNTWAVILLVMGVSYSIIKTIYIYNRQRNYPKAEKEWKGL